jgi:hypothetical protein
LVLTFYSYGGVVRKMGASALEGWSGEGEGIETPRSPRVGRELITKGKRVRDREVRLVWSVASVEGKVRRLILSVAKNDISRAGAFLQWRDGEVYHECMDSGAVSRMRVRRR